MFKEFDDATVREFNNSRMAIYRDMRSRLSKLNPNAPLNQKSLAALLKTQPLFGDAQVDSNAIMSTNTILKELYTQSLKQGSNYDYDAQRPFDALDGGYSRFPSKKVKRSEH